MSQEQAPLLEKKLSFATRFPMLGLIILFLLVPLQIILGLRDSMSVAALLITLKLADAYSLYLFLIVRSALYFVSAVGLWRHRFVQGYILTNIVLIASIAINQIAAMDDPVEKSRTLFFMIGGLITLNLLYFTGIFREERTTSSTPPVDEQEQLPAEEDVSD